MSLLPTGLGDAGQFAAVRHHPEANPAQTEPAVDGPRPPASGAPRVAADVELRRALLLDYKRLLCHWSDAYLHRLPLCRVGRRGRLPEGEAEPPQQRAALGIVLRCGHHGDVHPALPVYLVRVDLVEHDLLDQPEGVVTLAVELPVGQAAEVADPG